MRPSGVFEKPDEGPPPEVEVGITMAERSTGKRAFIGSYLEEENRTRVWRCIKRPSIWGVGCVRQKELDSRVGYTDASGWEVVTVLLLLLDCPCWLDTARR